MPNLVPPVVTGDDAAALPATGFMAALPRGHELRALDDPLPDRGDGTAGDVAAGHAAGLVMRSKLLPGGRHHQFRLGASAT